MCNERTIEKLDWCVHALKVSSKWKAKQESIGKDVIEVLTSIIEEHSLTSAE